MYMLKKKFDWKELGIDLLVDLAAGTDIAGRYEISVEQIDIREAGVSG